MAIARETVRLGLRPRAGRRRSRSASRCTRPSSSPRARERAAIERLGRRRPRGAQRQGAALRRRRPTSSAPTSSSPTTARSGPRFGKAMPQVAAAVAALDPGHVAARAARGPARSASPSTATTTSSAADDLLLALQPLEGYQLEREGSHAVALELALDDGAAPRGPGARGRPRGAERAQGGGPGRRGPHRADARRRRRAARRRPRARGVRRRRGRSRRASPTTAPGEGDAATIEGRELRIAVERA